MQKFGVVGCGKMGQALVSRIAKSMSCQIVCCDVSQNALDSMKSLVGDRAVYTRDVDDVAKNCDVVLISVKPAHAAGVMRHMAGGCSKIIISIVAGMKYETLRSFAGGNEVVRVMPNTPALVGSGAMVILDCGMVEGTKTLVNELFSKAGFVHFVQNESMMDAVTGLSGSGPALFAMMVEAMADAGVAQGLTRELARELARETMLGTAQLLEVQHPAILKENVMSPGGTTAAGVVAAEESGFRHAAMEFVVAASEKSRQMG